MSEPILTEDQRVAIRADVLALDPLTDEQLDALAEVLVDIRLSSGGGGRVGVPW